MAEVALTVMLVSSAGLLTRSFMRLVSQPTGFQSEGVLTFDLRPQTSRYPEPAEVSRFYSEVQARLSALPGVLSVGWTQDLPFSSTNWGMALTPSDGALAGQEAHTEWKMVNADYFEAMGMTMEAGRTFGPTEGSDDPAGVVVNRTLAELLWPNEPAVGRILPDFSAGDEPAPATIIGVVSDLRDNDFESVPDPLLYAHHVQYPERTMTVVVRTSGDPMSYLPAFRREVAAIDNLVAVGDPMAMDELLSEAVATPRLLSILIAGFGVAAMLLAGFGVYGVVANSVSLRVREFGIRMALGAQGEGLLALVLKDSLRMGVVGAVLGVFGSLVVGRILRGILFEVSPWDPNTLGASFAAVLVTVTAAGYIPAKRASRLDPMAAIGRS